MVPQPETFELHHMDYFQAQQTLFQLSTGGWVSKMIGLVAELQIADYLVLGDKTAEDLARITMTHPEGLYRGLRVLATAGILVESEGRKFSLPAASHILLTNMPGSMRAMMMYWNQKWHDLALSHAMHSIKTGEPSFPKAHGRSFFEWLQDSPEHVQIFNKAMTDFSAAKGAAVASAYPFYKYKYIVDIGGGHGALLAAVLKMAPNSRGILFDVPEVRSGAYSLLHSNDLLDRVDVVLGSFLVPDQIPFGYDVYILKHIIHAFGDDQAISILNQIAKAVTAQGRVLLLEYLVSDLHRGAIFDIDMLIMTKGGKERTVDEFDRLLQRAGLKLLRIIPTRSPLVIIEAAKPMISSTSPQCFVPWKS
jgi:hypothetical protein